ncbi:MAG: hypothetical protein K9L28_09775 [Synergistales bacterium]|nr:hypothetical protein [Synergistales bacterium]
MPERHPARPSDTDGTQREDVLLEAESLFPFPRWLRILLGIAGIVLLANALMGFVFHEMAVAAGLTFLAGCDRRNLLDSTGVVKETVTWLRTRRSVIPWEELQTVAVSTYGKRTMVGFVAPERRWRFLFRRDDADAVRSLVDRYAPQAEVTAASLDG